MNATCFPVSDPSFSTEFIGKMNFFRNKFDCVVGGSCDEGIDSSCLSNEWLICVSGGAIWNDLEIGGGKGVCDEVVGSRNFFVDSDDCWVEGCGWSILVLVLVAPEDEDGLRNENTDDENPDPDPGLYWVVVTRVLYDD